MDNIMNRFSLQGKTALVICPENPYGKEIVEGLLLASVQVWMAGDMDKMPDLPVAGRIAYDHGSAGSAAKLEVYIRSKLGTLDIVVENGMHGDAKGWELSYEQIYGALERTHLGTMLTVQAVGRVLAEQGHGSVILITDYGALVGYDPQNYEAGEEEEDFSLVKGFIRGGSVNYARQASNYLAEHGCRCNTIAFSPLAGEKSAAFEKQYLRHCQIKRMLQPEDITNALIFLASDASSYITGVTLPVDGGYTAK